MAADAEIRGLHLEEFAGGTDYMSREWCAALAQAAAVCLAEEGHASGIMLRVDGGVSERFTLTWTDPAPPAHRCWADPEEATEYGAYAVAIVLVHALTTLRVVERSRKGTGFDYWLGERDNPAPLFQEKTRLEVSGIRNGANTLVIARERDKVAQVQRYATEATKGLPAIVVIMEFGTPRSRYTKL